MISACVVDARRGVGREAKGMGMFWRRENERVRCGSRGLGRESRVTGEGDNWIEGGVEGSRTGDDDDDIKGIQKGGFGDLQLAKRFPKHLVVINVIRHQVRTTKN